MTDKTAQEAAREWVLANMGEISAAESLGAEPTPAINSLTALLESHASERERAAIERQWRPIAEYDRKKHTGPCAFYYKEHRDGRNYLSPLVTCEGPNYGDRECTHFKLLGTPPKDQPARQAKEDA